MKDEDKFKSAYRILTIVIILSAINSAVGYGLIMTFDFLPMFLMIPLTLPFILGCSTMFIVVIVEHGTKNLTLR